MFSGTASLLEGNKVNYLKYLLFKALRSSLIFSKLLLDILAISLDLVLINIGDSYYKVYYRAEIVFPTAKVRKKVYSKIMVK